MNFYRKLRDYLKHGKFQEVVTPKPTFPLGRPLKHRDVRRNFLKWKQYYNSMSGTIVQDKKVKLGDQVSK